jgi:predicted permease
VIAVLTQTAVLICCGLLWRLIRPLGLDVDNLRRSLTTLVYILLLPAMVLLVLWRAPLGSDSLRIAFLSACGIFTGLSAAWCWFRFRDGLPAMVGALILASGFGNVTYLGLPVLAATLGPWARGVAIQYDLFASTPLLLTLGLWIAHRYGGFRQKAGPMPSLFKEPPLWAALLAVALNLSGAPMPSWVEELLMLLANGVVPLMLISVGLALKWSPGWWRRMPLVLPVLIIQLALTPVVVWGLARLLNFHGDLLVAVVLEAAMPSMAIGVAICDRYRLATELYAEAFTLSTGLSLITLPLWFRLLA